MSDDIQQPVNNNSAVENISSSVEGSSTEATNGNINRQGSVQQGETGGKILQNIIVNIPESNQNEAIKANKISIIAIIVNAALFIITLLALYETKKSVDISSDALKDSRDNDVAEGIRNKEIDSFAKVQFEINYKKDSASLVLTRKSLQAQLDAIKKAQENFKIENEPYLQITDPFVTFEDYKYVTVKYDFVNIKKTPIKIIEQRDGVVVKVSPPLFSEIQKEKFDNPINRYVINESPLHNQKQFLYELNQPIVDLIKQRKYFVYYASEVKYMDLTNRKERYYKCLIKLRIYPDGSTKGDFLYNENADKE